MAKLERDENGVWTLERATGDRAANAPFDEAFPRYLTSFDAAFTKAREVCESEFVKALVRVGGLQDPGWDPYETTLRAIPAVRELQVLIPAVGWNEFELARHLQLWTYGHIIEASEPYAIVADMLHICDGGFFMPYRFPDKELRRARPAEPFPPKRPWFFSEKFPELETLAAAANLDAALDPIREIWDNQLRNAVFHADYSLHGGEVRTRDKTYSHDEVMTLVNRAFAHHEALSLLVRQSRLSYKEPTLLRLHRDAGATTERGVVMVRDGVGAIGFKHPYSAAEIAQGAIAWHMARLFPDEAEALRRDPALAHFRARREHRRRSAAQIARAISARCTGRSRLRHRLHRRLRR